MKYIYETRGRAREYCPLALNHYRGCTHGCTYCYVPATVRRPSDEFHAGASVRGSVEEIRADVMKASKAGMYGDVLLCFTSDPYQPLDAETGYTREVIRILQEGGFSVVVLTKAGPLAQRDLDILRPGVDTFAVSLTCDSAEQQREWEPGAGTPRERLDNLRAAHEAGLKTWVSCEPIIDVDATINQMIESWPYAGHFKVGKLNHRETPPGFYWKKILEQVTAWQEHIGRPFYIKKDLAVFGGNAEGYWIGGRAS